MLDPWIIEEIRRREQEERRRREEQEHPALEIPRHGPAYPEHEGHPGQDNDDDQRGVVIVDFRV
ncbi:MAG TPA: hypothetical protein VKN99_14790 [Polyangia bacterium]|nr:hypothetical protein [Polyangia bacterium]